MRSLATRVPVSIAAVLLGFVALGQTGCDASEGPARGASTRQSDSESNIGQPAQVTAAPGPTSLATLQSKLGLDVLTKPWSGDLDGMEQRRVIRVLTVYGLGRYFLDGPRERGVVYEGFKKFETYLNDKMQKGHLRVHVVFIPVSRDQLIPGLVEGRGDIAAAGLTITPDRDQLIDFSMPASKPIREILVTGPGAPKLGTLDDLAGREVAVRHSSSYFESLTALNERFAAQGLPLMRIEPISELLEDEDLLEMVNAGLLPWTVVDDYKTSAWTGVFRNLTPRDDLVLREGGRIGYAFRKNSPKLAAALNDFLAGHREGTLFGNILMNRYLRDFDWVANALAPEDFGRFEKVVGIFRKYGEEYGFDYLMVTAQGYQESRLNQDMRSSAGAVGIMQLLPSTAADPNVDIPNIQTADANVHAGIKYLDFIRKRYFDDSGIDRFNQTLLALAAYNAGPARVRDLREKARAQGLDPNKWFGNVEVIAAREIGRETVQYVANIYKYYITYRMSSEHMSTREKAREKAGIDPGA